MNFNMAAVAAILGFGTERFKQIYVTVIAPIKFWFKPTYGLGGDVVWRILAILEIGTEQL